MFIPVSIFAYSSLFSVDKADRSGLHVDIEQTVYQLTDIGSAVVIRPSLFTLLADITASPSSHLTPSHVIFVNFPSLSRLVVLVGHHKYYGTGRFSKLSAG